MDNTELLQRIEKLEKEIEFLTDEINTLKNFGVSEQARETIEKMERTNKIASLISSVSGEKLNLDSSIPKIDELKSIAEEADKQIERFVDKGEHVWDNIASETKLFDYRSFEDGVEITKYNGFNEEIIIIPNSLEGKSVIKIGLSVFKGCRTLKEIRLPRNLKILGACAFEDCSNLKQIELPDKLTIIQGSPFKGTSITHLIIPENVETIGGNVLDSPYQNKKTTRHIAFLGKSIRFMEQSCLNTSFYNNCIFYCLPGCTAQEYARKHNIPLKPLVEFPKEEK